MDSPQIAGWHTPLSVTIFAVCVLFAILTGIFTVLRFIARSGKSGSLATYGIDDWVILAASIVSIAHAIMTAWGAAYGSIGRSVLTMTLLQVATFEKLLFASEFISLGALTLVKISILLFYKRIFTVAKFPLIANIMMGIIVAWFTAFFLVMLFAGDPISDSWTHMGTPRYDFAPMLEAYAYTDILIDVIVLAMPIPMIRSLHLDMKRKLSVGGIFSLGLFCVIASSIRLHYVVDFAHLYNGQNYDAFSDKVTLIFLWSNIEPCCSVIAACLPTLGPLFKNRQFGLLSRLRSYWSSRSFSSLNDDRKTTMPQHSGVPYGSDANHMPWNPKNSVSAYASTSHETELGDLERQDLAPNRGIRVEQSFSAVS